MAQIFLVTGATGIGKTTRLMQWSAGRKDVGGLLSPVINGKRFFVDIESQQSFHMEAVENETDTQKIGRFTFSGEAFRRANRILQDLRDSNAKWIIIDEIGPLELQSKGLSEGIKALMETMAPNVNLIIVVRETILPEVFAYFNLLESKIEPFLFPKEG